MATETKISHLNFKFFTLLVQSLNKCNTSILPFPSFFLPFILQYPTWRLDLQIIQSFILKKCLMSPCDWCEMTWILENLTWKFNFRPSRIVYSILFEIGFWLFYSNILIMKFSVTTLIDLKIPYVFTLNKDFTKNIHINTIKDKISRV